MIRTIKLFFQWLKRRQGKPVVDYTKGCGYYLHTGLIFHDPRKHEHVWKMTSGKEMRVKLLDYSTFTDPHDMVRESTWQYLGYVGEKPFAEMSFREYLKEAR